MRFANRCILFLFTFYAAFQLFWKWGKNYVANQLMIEKYVSHHQTELAGEYFWMFKKIK